MVSRQHAGKSFADPCKWPAVAEAHEQSLGALMGPHACTAALQHLIVPLMVCTKVAHIMTELQIKHALKAMPAVVRMRDR